MKSTSILIAIVILRGGSDKKMLAFGQQYKLPWWHPSLQRVADELLAAPPGHPLLDDHDNFQGFIESYTDENHYWFDGDDGFVLAPWELPGGHPGLDRLYKVEDTPYGEFPIVYFNHLDLDESYRQGKHLPIGHPSVMDLLGDLLPPNHPDCDDLLGIGLSDEWHINISILLNVYELPKGYPTVTVYFDHPDADENYMRGNPQPIDHPSIEEMLLEYLPPNHPQNLDEMIRDPSDFPLPFGHPSLNSIIKRVEETSETESAAMSIKVLPTNIPFLVSSSHPALVEGMTISPFKHHPAVHHLWTAHHPHDHPNIDDLIEDPSWHPPISHMIAPRVLAGSPGSLLCYALSALFVVALVLRNYKHWYNSNRTSKNFSRRTSKDGAECDVADTLLSSIDLRDCRLEVGAKFDEVLDCCPTMNQTMSNDIEDEVDLVSSSSDKTTIPPSPPPCLPHNEGVENDLSSSTFSSLGTAIIALSRLDQRHHDAMELNCKQRILDKEPVWPTVIAYQEKRNTRLRTAWANVFGKCISGTHHSHGYVVFCLFYVAVNVAALLLSPYDLNVGFDSLAAGNIVYLVVSAIKNSVVTWFLGMAFDQVIVYHQFIGQVTVMMSFIHSCFYFDRLVEFMSNRMYKTGFIALMFGIFITISSLNWIRREILQRILLEPLGLR